jgi:hypothetical protein
LCVDLLASALHSWPAATGFEMDAKLAQLQPRHRQIHDHHG